MSVNSVLTNAASQITGAIRQAARSTGISFEYLLTAAKIESNLNPSAQASTSSAKGLYQFIDQTWLATMKQDGPANGYGRYADAISRTADGRYTVADPTMRAEIMQLRSDPAASAMMAGSFTRANAEQLRSAIGRPPSDGELYIAHFLGSYGAGKLIGAAMSQPQANAVAMFPQAAAANPSIFHDRSGRQLSVIDVYAKLTGRFDVARAAKFAPSVVTASAVSAVSATSTPSIVSTASPSAAAPVPLHDTAGLTQAFADAHDGLPPLPDSKPLFQSMFTDRARRAVTMTVAGLWTPAKDAVSNDARPAARTPADPARPLDLFTDSPTDARSLFRGSV